MRNHSRARVGIAAAALLSLSVAGLAATGGTAAAKPKPIDVQILSFNDYHGQLEAVTGGNGVLGSENPANPNQPVGGAEYLATHLAELREGVKHTSTVAAGDLIGGTPFLSGLFHDEPSVESLNALGLDVSSVGNHEFDEGVAELLRMQDGGCHPEDGCYFPDEPYAGADFDWLAANVRYKEGTAQEGKTVLPPYWVKTYGGARVAYIGMTLEGTPEIVAQAGIRDVEFLDEAETANALVPELKKQGIESIVVLLHEGGFAPGGYDECIGGALSDPVRTIADNLDPEIDLVVTGHTHSPYVCELTDPAGQPRFVTSASAFGRVITETWLKIDRKTKDVIRDQVTSVNHLVTRDVEKDALQTAILAKWQSLSAEVANVVVGTIGADITRAPNRQTEGAAPNTIADAQLFVTEAADAGGSVAALMNPGGVRADFLVNQISGGEQPGEVTYGEAFAVQPFGNLVVSMTLTGAQIDAVLEQQFALIDPDGSTGPLQPVKAVRLLLGVSDGFTYTYDLNRPLGDIVDIDTIAIDGASIDPAASYRITVNSFLADGGDGFTVLAQGTDRVGGGVDLDAMIDYLEANPGLMPAPTDRVTEIALLP